MDLSPPYIYYFFTFLVIAVGWIIALRQYIRTRYIAQLYLCGAWFCLGFFYSFNILGYLFDSIPFIYISTFVWVFEVFLMVLFLDSLSRESVDPWKICGAAVLSTFLLCTAWSPDAIVYFSIGPGLYGWDWGAISSLRVT